MPLCVTMCAPRLTALAAILFLCVSSTCARSEDVSCRVAVRIESGPLCGQVAWAGDTPYASFRGIPYAKQPLGDLRFKELQPVERWNHTYDATEEKRKCPQVDWLYTNFTKSSDMSEACIYANVHIPYFALPGVGNNLRPSRDLKPPHVEGSEEYGAPHEGADYGYNYEESRKRNGLPILVFVHGGAYQLGSGNGDVYGPEYMINQGVIVITFNYRIGAFGFLSLNSSSIPGNNGLRDTLTLLRWVQKNARAFGGDPDDVTLAGQSAGGTIAHLLSLSLPAEGLFKRVILMSGIATRFSYSNSPGYSAFIARSFLARLNINETDPEEIHRQLTEVPLQQILDATSYLQDLTGIVVFAPVVESPHPGVTIVVDDDPEVLMAKGRGRNLTMMLGFTNKECETFRPRMTEVKILSQIAQNPLILVPPTIVFTSAPEILAKHPTNIYNHLFGDQEPTMDRYIDYCTQAYFTYPIIKLAQLRAKHGVASTYLYEFAYKPDYSSLQRALGLNVKGIIHVEDVSFIFRFNELPLSNHTEDVRMRSWVTQLFSNFIKYENPSHPTSGWLPVDTDTFKYQLLDTPKVYQGRDLTNEQEATVRYFNQMYMES